MPLSTGTGKAAFSKNVATEVATGKPQKQAVAIAYSQQSRNKTKGHTGDCVGDCCPKCAASRLRDVIRSLSR